MPDYVANQIAAGEVVQRPESVVKELAENSIDAGADEILILVKKGGKKLIYVVDNGSGIEKDDLPLAIKRHATSKILDSKDLEEIKTFGFRGEALASIASVSSLEIRSRTPGSPIGWRLLSDPPKEPIIEPINMDFGVQIYVKNLFYNVPARKKFLKSDIAEFKYVSDAVIRLALAKPEIRFAFYDDDLLIFDAPKSDLKGRIGAIMGKTVQNSLIPVETEIKGAKIWGYVGEPLIAKKSKSNQYLFVNGRAVFSKSLNYAVFAAFEKTLEKASYPFFVINVDIDPKLIDVNVHPQKREIKFEDEREIFSAITKAVAKALENANIAPKNVFKGTELSSPFLKNESSKSDYAIINKTTGEIVSAASRSTFSLASKREKYRAPSSYEPKLPRRKEIIPDKNAFDALLGKEESLEKSSPVETLPLEEERRLNLWQLSRKYIFVQTETGFMAIDQHAAHERILYEKALRAMEKSFDYSQKTLFPQKAVLNPSQLATLKDIEKEVRALGFDFELKGQVAALTAVPIDIAGKNEAKAFVDILDDYEERSRASQSESRENLAASYSCKAAIKTGQKLSREEMERLIEDLFKCSMPYVCPHGRPLIIEFDLKELDKRFGRT